MSVNHDDKKHLKPVIGTDSSFLSGKLGGIDVSSLYRLALRITSNRQEAEDVVQDVVVKLWQMRERFDEIENLEAFAMRMVRNLALDHLRLKTNHTESIDGMDFMSSAPNIEQDMERKERLDSIRAIMALMPEKLRTAMQLRDFDGMSYKEISDIMQVSEDQVKVCIFRARQFVKLKVGQGSLQ